MPDHSPAYTEADAKIVTDAVRKILPSDEPFAVLGTGWIVGAVLDALAAAGRLLPEPAEREWRVELPNGGAAVTTEGLARITAERAGGKLLNRLVTPWVELDENTPEGEQHG